MDGQQAGPEVDMRGVRLDVLEDVVQGVGATPAAQAAGVRHCAGGGRACAPLGSAAAGAAVPKGPALLVAAATLLGVLCSG